MTLHSTFLIIQTVYGIHLTTTILNITIDVNESDLVNFGTSDIDRIHMFSILLLSLLEGSLESHQLNLLRPSILTLKHHLI